ncbi:MAG: hypothetical protein WC795_01755 [Candidatus Paceibacterota bacterium]|jgi:hypothetical protein
MMNLSLWVIILITLVFIGAIIFIIRELSTKNTPSTSTNNPTQGNTGTSTPAPKKVDYWSKGFDIALVLAGIGVVIYSFVHRFPTASENFYESKNFKILVGCGIVVSLLCRQFIAGGGGTTIRVVALIALISLFGQAMFGSFLENDKLSPSDLAAAAKIDSINAAQAIIIAAEQNATVREARLNKQEDQPKADVFKEDNNESKSEGRSTSSRDITKKIFVDGWAEFNNPNNQNISLSVRNGIKTGVGIKTCTGQQYFWYPGEKPQKSWFKEKFTLQPLENDAEITVHYY